MQIRLFGIALAILLAAVPCVAATATADSAVVSPTTEAAEADAAETETVVPSLVPAATLPASGLLPEDTNVPDGFSLMARTALSLGAVLLVIWGVLVLLRRTTGGGLKLGRGHSHIRVLDKTYLAPKRAVYVVQIGQRKLALGVTDTQISPLAELNDDDFPPQKAAPNAATFAGVLDGARRRFGKPNDTKSPDTVTTESTL